MSKSDGYMPWRDQTVLDVIADNTDYDARIKHMVDRFLGWKLPEDFIPDGGIKYEKPNDPNFRPIGTNLLTATQAEEMIRYIIATPPTSTLKGGDCE